jgi:hypothetical protein
LVVLNCSVGKCFSNFVCLPQAAPSPPTIAWAPMSLLSGRLRLGLICWLCLWIRSPSYWIWFVVLALIPFHPYRFLLLLHLHPSSFSIIWVDCYQAIPVPTTTHPIGCLPLALGWSFLNPLPTIFSTTCYLFFSCPIDEHVSSITLCSGWLHIHQAIRGPKVIWSSLGSVCYLAAIYIIR